MDNFMHNAIHRANQEGFCSIYDGISSPRKTKEEKGQCDR